MSIRVTLFVFLVINFTTVYAAVCPSNGLTRTQYDVNSNKNDSTNVVIVDLKNRTESFGNKIYWYEGSIIPDQSGPHLIRIEYGGAVSAAFNVGGQIGNCTNAADCIVPSTFSCAPPMSIILAAGYYTYINVTFQLSPCASSGWISLRWQTPTNTNWVAIPQQNLCSYPYSNVIVSTTTTTSSTSATTATTATTSSTTTTSTTTTSSTSTTAKPTTTSTSTTAKATTSSSTSSSTTSGTTSSTTTTSTSGTSTSSSSSTTSSTTTSSTTGLTTSTSGPSTSSSTSSSSTGTQPTSSTTTSDTTATTSDTATTTSDVTTTDTMSSTVSSTGVTTTTSDTSTTGDNSTFAGNNLLTTGKSSSEASNVLIPVLVSIFSVLLIVVIVAAIIYVRRYRKNQHSSAIELVPKGTLKMKDIEIKESIGSGQFGQVYRGVWQKTIQVALKTLRVDNAEFDKEIEILSGMRHPNIVTFYGIFVVEEKTYMVVELCSMGSALTLVQNGEIKPSQLLSIAMDVASGMKYLHQMSIIHADLALRNILIVKGEEGYQAKISDFGLSKMIFETSYYKGSTVGIPVRWSPPEVIEYGKFTFASDCWSFGILLWELFNRGKIPFGGWSNQQVIDKIVNGEMLPMSETPEKMYGVMKKCWKREAKERLSMENIYEELNDIYGEQNAKKRDVVVSVNETNYVNFVYN